MKHEWRKKEKHIYLPKTKPEIIEVPTLKYFTISGEGNPNDNHFQELISILYSLSYSVKMSHKKGLAPSGYFDYTVYSLEGVWRKSNNSGDNNNKEEINKNTLAFKLMIRQPDFVDSIFAQQIIDSSRNKLSNDLLDQVNFESIYEGKCVQILHIGTYDAEYEAFYKMKQFAEQNNLRRKSASHKEIYLSDPRRVAPEKLKTTIRVQVE